MGEDKVGPFLLRHSVLWQRLSFTLRASVLYVHRHCSAVCLTANDWNWFQFYMQQILLFLYGINVQRQRLIVTLNSWITRKAFRAIVFRCGAEF